MRILFLTQIIPWPPDAGPKVKTWHVLRYLKDQGHEVILASFVRPEEEPYVAALRDVCVEVHTVPMHRSLIANIRYYLRSLATRRPFLIERDDLAGMRRLVETILATNAIDLIHADQLSMVQFAFPDAYPIYQHSNSNGNVRSNGHRQPRPFLVFDAHNAVWTIIERMKQKAPWFIKPILALEARRIKKYEGAVVRYVDHTFAVAEPDAAALRQAAYCANGQANSNGCKISVIPIAVDAGLLQPVERERGSLNILTLGTLHYPPNADGIRWFTREVYPLVRQQVPNATLTIIGKKPPKDFVQLAAGDPDAIQVTGYIEDLTPYFQKAALVVVPVRAGGGMRVRILEAFARGMPVVTTTVGLEGIEATPGQDVFVEDSPEGFAAAVVALLGDAHLQERLAQNGRSLAETRYDFQTVLGELNKVYDPADSPQTKRPVEGR